MKRLIIFLFILSLCITFVEAQITTATYTNKGAAVPFLNSSTYKLNGVVIDTANTAHRGFFTPFQYNKLQSAYGWGNHAGLYKRIADSVNISGYATQYDLLHIGGQWITTGSDIYYNLGKVGIGKTPSATLDVNGTFSASTSISSPDIQANTILGVGGKFSQTTNLEDGDVFTIGNYSYGNIVNINNTTNKILLDEDNQGFLVGVGKNNPAHKVDVKGGVNADSILIGGVRKDVLWSKWTATGNNIYFMDGVGIGTNNPQADLHVVGDSLAFETTGGFSFYDNTLDNNIFSYNSQTEDVFFESSLGLGVHASPYILNVNGSINGTTYYLNGVLKSNQFHDSVTVNSNKLTLSGKQKLDVNQANIDHNSLLNYKSWRHYKKVDIDSVSSSIPYDNSKIKMVMIDTTNGKLSRRTFASGLTANYMPSWNGYKFANSVIQQDGTNVGIGTAPGTYTLSVAGSIKATSFIQSSQQIRSPTYIGTGKLTTYQVTDVSIDIFPQDKDAPYIRLGNGNDNTTFTTQWAKFTPTATVINNTINYGADAGANDAYACTIGDIPAYVTGMILYVKCNTANTGACSLNVNALGAINLKSLHDQDPQDNYIEAGSIVHLVYDGTNFQILSPDSNP